MAAGTCASRARHFPGIAGAVLFSQSWRLLGRGDMAKASVSESKHWCWADQDGPMPGQRLRTSSTMGAITSEPPPPRPHFLPLFGLSLLLQPMPTSSPNSAGSDLLGLCGRMKRRAGILHLGPHQPRCHAPWDWDLDGDSRQSDQRFPPFSCPHVTYLISLPCPVPRPHPSSDLDSTPPSAGR